ncbi:MAG: carbon-nitrogen hydrolase family protein [Solirubrobacterales bacterium]
MRAAAIQLAARVADVDANLEACERLADRAGADGAECIVLPEFFTTGIGFVPELADAALAPDGEATDLLRSLARRHGALVGGSFLCRDADGEVRNAFLLSTPDGELAGRHDKDLPTMWENAFYVGGDDDGVIPTDELTVGAAVCWELMRTQTVRRLRGRIDLAMTGSGWWSIPQNLPPRALMRRAEAGNRGLARRAAQQFALFVGAPVIHAAHCGPLRCRMPWSPIGYEGHFEGWTMICDASGRVLAGRAAEHGEGVVAAEIEPRHVPPALEPPDRFWLHHRGVIPAFTWWYQRLWGRPWYREHVAGRAARPARERAAVP